MNENLEIFCCYARKDQSLLLKLRTHLAFLEREGSLNIWYDQDISPGTEWEEEINKHLNAAHIILLLISPDFMTSEYCTSHEMKRAMERHECGEARVIPILLRPSAWQVAPFAKLQVLPNNALAVTEWRNREKALFAIAQRIEQVVKELLTKPSMTPSHQPPSTVSATGLHTRNRAGIVRSYRDADFSPDGKPLASRDDDYTARLWELSSGRYFNTQQDHSQWVYSVAFSPDGGILAGGSYDHTVRLWEVSSGRCLNILRGHTEIVYSVAFSPDGKTLASGSGDHTVRLWDVSSGRCLNILQGHSQWVYSVTFSPDGKTLACGSSNGAINLWEEK